MFASPACVALRRSTRAGVERNTLARDDPEPCVCVGLGNALGTVRALLQILASHLRGMTLNPKAVRAARWAWPTRWAPCARCCRFWRHICEA